jgi:hypothetical protein
MRNREKRRELAFYIQSTASNARTSRGKRRYRRDARRHAKNMVAAGCPEKAAVWRRRARNG